MELEIFTNREFFNQNKKDFLDKQDIFVDTDFYYQLDNELVYPESLKKIVEYLKYTDSINLYLDTTLVSFVNLIVIVNYLYQNGYENDLVINYYNNQTYKVIIKKKLYNSLYKECKKVLEYFKGKKDNEIFSSDLKIVIPNFKQCISLYDSIYYEPSVIEAIILECNEEYDDSIDNFLDSYNQTYGFSKEYIEQLFNKWSK